MNVLLIQPKSQTAYPQPPLGLLSLAGTVERIGHNAQIADCNVLKHPVRALIELGADADLIGVSISSHGYSSGMDIIRILRGAYPRVPVIVGGPHASALPQETLDDSGCDSVVVGEGEDILEEILREGITPQGVIAATEYVQNMDNLPLPAYSLICLTKYRPHAPHGRKRPFAPMVTSRGCPYRCTFCSKSVFGSHYRYQSPRRTLEEMQYLITRHGVREIAFYDDVFTLRKDRVMEICYLIRSAGLKIEWSCETRVDLVDKELLIAMKEAGCRSVSYGIESANEDVLDYVGKKTHPNQAIEAVQATKAAGMQAIGYFMFVPGVDTVEDERRTVEFAIGLDLDYVQFAVLAPLPGSTLYLGQDKAATSEYGGITGRTKYSTAWAYRRYYLRGGYILRRATSIVKSPSELAVTLRGAVALLKEAKG